MVEGVRLQGYCAVRVGRAQGGSARSVGSNPFPARAARRRLSVTLCPPICVMGILCH